MQYVLFPSKFFRFVEVAPLLCVIDDFLEELDLFFADSESDSPKKEGDGGINEDPPSSGSALPPIEADYLRGLELYCLLKCRLLKMKHQWRSVVDQSVCSKWRGA